MWAAERPQGACPAAHRPRAAAHRGAGTPLCRIPTPPISEGRPWGTWVGTVLLSRERACPALLRESGMFWNVLLLLWMLRGGPRPVCAWVFPACSQRAGPGAGAGGLPPWTEASAPTSTGLGWTTVQ